MTELQSKKIASYRKAFEENVEKWIDWDSENTCLFEVYQTISTDDDNIILLITSIDKVHDSLAGVMTSTEKILVTPAGEIVNLSSAVDQDKIDDFIATLKKIA
jgi:GTP-binding protein EngB required for normal cell division